MKHRARNTGKIPDEIIEVSIGDYANGDNPRPFRGGYERESDDMGFFSQIAVQFPCTPVTGEPVLFIEIITPL